jgi:transcriptional antiterminator Rof (Rho-off)
MTVQPDSPRFEQSLEGQQFKVEGAEQLKHLIELAFDYRGDVTLELRSGERLEGYVYHRNSQEPSPSLKVFPKNQAGTREVGYEDIVSLAFSGEDTAFGKSWEDWLKKKPQDNGKN